MSCVVVVELVMSGNTQVDVNLKMEIKSDNEQGAGMYCILG